MIGRCVADAVALPDDMELMGVADVVADYRIQMAEVARVRGLYAAAPDNSGEMREAGISVRGALDDWLNSHRFA